jgi:hypothetical protein
MKGLRFVSIMFRRLEVSSGRCWITGKPGEQRLLGGKADEPPMVHRSKKHSRHELNAYMMIADIRRGIEFETSSGCGMMEVTASLGG